MGISSVTTLGTQTRRVVVVVAGAETAAAPHPLTTEPPHTTFPLTIELPPHAEPTEEPQPELDGALHPQELETGALHPQPLLFRAQPQPRDRPANMPLPHPPPETLVMDMAALPQPFE